MVSWAPESPGPVSDCRSHFCESFELGFSSGNLQNTSFMTKQCPKRFHEVFPIFSLFFELLRLRDQSQIVDLAERIWMVSLRARETFMVPRWWQNKVLIFAYLVSCFNNNLCLLSGKYHRRKGVAYIITKYYTVITKYNLYMDPFFLAVLPKV